MKHFTLLDLECEKWDGSYHTTNSEFEYNVMVLMGSWYMKCSGYRNILLHFWSSQSSAEGGPMVEVIVI